MCNEKENYTTNYKMNMMNLKLGLDLLSNLKKKRKKTNK